MTNASPSLFSKLKDLFRTTGFPMENFLTELAADSMARNPKDLVEWLRVLGITDLAPDAFVDVQTQFHCSPDEAEELGSKFPDMVIHLTDRTRSEIIFVESKVGSDLSGKNQLQIYARLLSKRIADRRTLLFVTRDYLPQERKEVLSLVSAGSPAPGFVQARWHSFAAHWSRAGGAAKRDPIAGELVQFMKEQNLMQETQLTPQALLALGGFHQALDVLRAALDDELRSRMEQVAGNVRDAYDTAAAIGKERMFVLRSKPAQFWINVGFWLPADDNGFPTAFGDVAFAQKITGKKEILTALKEFSNRPGSEWEADNLSDVAPVGRIVKQRSLSTFLAEKNHVAALKKYFHGILDDIAALRKKYPDLPWK